jgi:hypothetical protein
LPNNSAFSNSYTIAIQSQSFGLRTDACHALFGADGMLSTVRDLTHGRVTVEDGGYDLYEGVAPAACVDNATIAKYTGVAFGSGMSVAIFPVSHGRIAWWVTRATTPINNQSKPTVVAQSSPNAATPPSSGTELPANYDPTISDGHSATLLTLLTRASWAGPIADLIRASHGHISHRHGYRRAPLVDRPYRALLHTPPGALPYKAIYPITIIGNAARPLPHVYLQVTTRCSSHIIAPIISSISIHP